jgi:hypothetical protein
MNLLNNDTIFTHLRLGDLVTKYHRGEIVFGDHGYVDKIDEYLTGCLSNLPNSFNVVIHNGPYEVLGESGCKRFRTLVDFTEDKITCQGTYFSAIPGYLQHRLNNLEIGCNMVLNLPDNRKEITNYLRDNF